MGYGNLVYHRLCNRSGTDRILHVGADSGKLTILKLLLLMGTAVGGYLILLILYCTGARMFYKRKHNLAKQHVKNIIGICPVLKR